MKRILTLLGVMAGLIAGRAQDNSLPTIFVAPLEGDLSQIQGWQPALGEGLAEMLVTELGKLSKFQVLESTALEHLKDEMKLGDEGYVAEGEKVEKGGWSGADFMFRGKVTRFGGKSQGLNLGGLIPGSGGNLGLRSRASDVRIDWRIVDVANRRVLKTGQAVGQEKGLGFDIGVGVKGHGGNIGFQNEEFMNSALGKATVKALALITADLANVQLPASARRLAQEKGQRGQQAAAEAATLAAKNTPGKILAVAGKTTVIVSLGSQQGFKSGDKLKVYEAIEIKDDKGQVVFTEEKLVGEVTLDSVQNDRSKATYTGSTELKAGWVVKAN